MTRFYLILSALLLSACATTPMVEKASIHPEVKKSQGLCKLETLPTPVQKIPIAVYDFPDLTGAFKPNDGFAVYSKAVPQGADAIVIDALLRTGQGKWFDVMERRGLTNLVQERKIQEVKQKINAKSEKRRQELAALLQQEIENSKSVQHQNPGDINTKTSNPLKLNTQTNFAMQQDYIPKSGATTDINNGSHALTPRYNAQPIITNNYKPLGILKDAKYILEGGIIGYDTDEVTGGGGVRLLNIGGFGEVRKDVITINMRLVNITDGSVVLNTTMTKGIYSQKLQGSGFGYVEVDRILEAEAGIGYNEPVFQALNVTVQAAIYDLVQQGIQRDIFKYANNQEQIVQECQENATEPKTEDKSKA